MKPFKKNSVFLLLFLAVILFLPAIGFAQDPAASSDAVSRLPALLPPCTDTGACRVCDIVGVFITLGRWLITGAAGLALLVIVYAGSSLVFSAGNAEKIGSAKKQIVGAVLGLGLV
ncbi:MAG: hypothetical protein Q8L21_03100, partial [Candidatus Komeilibacteria bacterium]|nr:hypothetical protein [Candidatus Komeilibacteria bacterium]